MLTDVAITFDIEFDINGAFNDPDRRCPCGPEGLRPIAGGEDIGLGFVLDTLDAHGLKGTFFIETLNRHYFGDDPMGRIARAIADRGHDLGLHLHPVWTTFRSDDWLEMVRKEPRRAQIHDNLGILPAAEAKDLIADGLATFERWGLPRPTALRAGNLMAGPAVYAAMADSGLFLASNVGAALYRLPDNELQFYSGCHVINGVTEVPVTSVADIDLPFLTHEKLATLVGLSIREVRVLLDRAEEEHVAPVVFLHHVAEFLDRSNGTVRPSAVMHERFEWLCGHLRHNPDRFHVTTFRAAMERWQSSGVTANHRITLPPWAVLPRLAGKVLRR